MPDYDAMWAGHWDRVASRLLSHLVNGRGHFSTGHVGLQPRLRSRVRVLAKVALSQGSQSWTPPMEEAWAASNGLAASVNGPSREDALVAKAVRLAHAVLTDRPGDVPRQERAFVTWALRPWHSEDEHVRFLASLAALDDVPRAAGGPVTDVVAFLRPWKAVTRRNAAATVSVAEGHARLRHVREADAPPVLRLRMPSGDWMTVREHQGVLIRPVLAPGTSRPATVEAFAQAARSGEAWADDPFGPQARDAAVLFDLPQRSRPVSPAGADAEAAARAATELALHRAGDLTVVDGIVHRKTGTPTCTMSARLAPDPSPIRADVTVHQSWRLAGDLDMWDPQESVDRTNARVTRQPLSLRFEAEMPDHFEVGVFAVPIGDAEALRSLAVAAFEGRRIAWGHPSEPGRVMGVTSFVVDGDPAVEVLDAGRFPPDPSSLARAVGAWAAADDVGRVVRDAGNDVLDHLRELGDGTCDVAALLDEADRLPDDAPFPGSLTRMGILATMVREAVRQAVPGHDEAVDAFRP